MLVIEPDLDRMIDLPGVGSTPRPVDIDRSVTGFADLVSLRIYDFAESSVIDGEAEGDEVLVTLLSGAATIEVTGRHEVTFTLHDDGDRAIYLPPHHHYRLTPLAPAGIAYARAVPGGAGAPRAYRPLGGVLSVEEGPSRLRLRLLPLAGETDASGGLGDGCERLVHLTGPATVTTGGRKRQVGAMDTLALGPGEAALVLGGGGEMTGGELLVVAALRRGA